MEVIRIAALGIVGVMMATELKGQKQGYGLYIALGISVMIFTFSVDKIILVVQEIESLKGFIQGSENYLSLLLKVVGITYLCEFASGICRDAGFGAIAGQIQIFGKLYTMVAGMPIIFQLIQTMQELG